MSVVVSMEHDEHFHVQALLPWYARGQLGQDEFDEVQRHLLQCPACRAELAAEQPMQALLKVVGATFEAGDAEAGLARMRTRLQQVKAKADPPRWMPWALGLQGAACVLLLGLWLQARQGEPAEAPAYQGLAAPGGAPVAANALVMFKPGTSERALRELLQDQEAGIVAGPTETGAYLLRIDARGLAALRTAPIVALAEPLQPGRPR
jgi:anti-sigma factor RsiW